MGEPMQMVPASVGRCSRSWDEQHLDLRAAAGRIGRAAQGFTPEVTSAAQRFTRTWERHAAVTADGCEARADGLRQIVADWLATDEGAAASALDLVGYLEELR